jgi:hypothetical protein
MKITSSALTADSDKITATGRYLQELPHLLDKLLRVVDHLLAQK